MPRHADANRDAGALPTIAPPRGDVSAVAAVLGVAGGLLWPIALRGQFSAGDYLGLLAACAVVVAVGGVLVVARGTRTLGTAMLVGALPVASLQVWWLLTASWAEDWPVPVSSALLTAGGLVAAFARRDPAVPSAQRRWAFGLTAVGLLAYLTSLLLAKSAVAALVAVVVLVVPLVISFGTLVGRRLGTALATAALLLALSLLQQVSVDSFLSPAIVLQAAAVAAIAAAGAVAALNPVVSYTQRTPVAPALAAVGVTAVLLVTGTGMAAAAAAEPLDDSTSGSTASAAPGPQPTKTPSASGAVPSGATSSGPATPAPLVTTAATVEPYPGQRPVTATTERVGAACDVTAPRVICIDKTASKLYFIADGRVLLKLDARFGGVTDPTREGAFAIYRKDRDHVSTTYGSAMPYAMFFDGGEAIHLSSDFAAVGYAGHSHGCVNIRDEDELAWLYDQVPLGTPVYIYS